MGLNVQWGVFASLVVLFGGCAEVDAPDTDISGSSFRCAAVGSPIIGLEGVDISGTVDVDAPGGIFSNGDIHVRGNVDVRANLSTSLGAVVTSGMPNIEGEAIEGVESFAIHVLPYANALAAAQELDDNPDSLSSGTLRLTGRSTLELTGGTYYFDEISISGQAELHVTGPTKIYVGGRVSISGGTRTNSTSPADLELISLSDEDVSISGHSASAMSIIAPLARVKLSGTGALIGAIVGRQVAISGTSEIIADDNGSFNGHCEDDEPRIDPSADGSNPACEYFPAGDDRCW